MLRTGGKLIVALGDAAVLLPANGHQAVTGLEPRSYRQPSWDRPVVPESLAATPLQSSF